MCCKLPKGFHDVGIYLKSFSEDGDSQEPDKPEQTAALSSTLSRTREVAKREIPSFTDNA